MVEAAQPSLRKLNSQALQDMAMVGCKILSVVLPLASVKIKVFLSSTLLIKVVKTPLNPLAQAHLFKVDVRAPLSTTLRANKAASLLSLNIPVNRRLVVILSMAVALAISADSSRTLINSRLQAMVAMGLTHSVVTVAMVAAVVVAGTTKREFVGCV